MTGESTARADCSFITWNRNDIVGLPVSRPPISGPAHPFSGTVPAFALAQGRADPILSCVFCSVDLLPWLWLQVLFVDRP